MPSEEKEPKVMTVDDLEGLSWDDDDSESDRPELDIAPKDRKLVTQPFDFIVGSLSEQITDGQLILQDDYQRRHVWDDKKASRLIESLLLNVPIPVCYFAELNDGTYSVIDGQQRLTSIYNYIKNEYALKGLRVRPELNKKKFSQLDKTDQRLIRTRSIRCIVIQKESHPAIRFDVFERLNQGAVRLTAQELRNSTYRGDLNTIIRELCEDPQFQAIRRASGTDIRMGDAEMILRFFAFHFNAKDYRGFFAPFLDKYLEDKMKMTQEDRDRHRGTFKDTVSKVASVFGSDAFRQIGEDGTYGNQVNRAIYDVVMLTFAHIPASDLIEKRVNIINALRELCTSNAAFQDAIGRATRDRVRVQTRIDVWSDKLRDIGFAVPELKYGK